MCASEMPNLSMLRTLGCHHVHVQPSTTARYGKLVPGSHLGIFLGYSCSHKIFHYYDTKSALVKTASHAPFDEVMNDPATTPPPPNMQILRQLNNNGSLAPDEINMLPFDLSDSDSPFDCLDELSPAVIEWLSL